MPSEVCAQYILFDLAITLLYRYSFPKGLFATWRARKVSSHVARFTTD